MLKLTYIVKKYTAGDTTIEALRDVNIQFRKSEFVSILGPSGCGKTTLLNVIGGLDHYDSGDLIINGLSTKNFKSNYWDAYRNKSIGFVFQSYNLIAHQTVLQNVEIALTLSGVSSAERKRRAKQVLTEVGLSDQIKKKPNQLSGGQMQRVAIARALINDPDIILADEPTGALDSHTSVQVMEILKEVAKTRLVIMVTHNSELAQEYSSRVIRLLDGEIQSDSNPLTDEETETAEETDKIQKFQQNYKKTSMSLLTATLLSFRNLQTKRGRTILTSIAGSIGIIGVALVLALSNGLSNYMNSMQSDTLSSYPITINTREQNVDFSNYGFSREKDSYKEYPNENTVYSYDNKANKKMHKNVFTQDYLDYIKKMESEMAGSINSISYTYDVTVNLLAKGQDTVVKFETKPNASGMMDNNSNSYWQELPENENFTLSQYDVIGKGSRMPKSKNEVVLVVDRYNRVDKAFFEKLGINETKDEYKLTDFVGKTILKLMPNDNFYTQNGELFTAASTKDYKNLYESEVGTELTIVGILRPKKDTEINYMSTGIAYTSALTTDILKISKDSVIATSQKNSDKDVLLGRKFANESEKKKALLNLGADSMPTAISVYPKNYEGKDNVKEYLDNYNDDKSKKDQIIYLDMAETIASLTGTLLDTVTYVLVGFAAISLIVSTVMIGIITYVSVIERTKEIGILRSVGARKKDISRIFNAETLIVGFAAGAIGIGVSFLLTIPINIIIENLVGLADLSSLKLIHAAALVLGSIVLTLIAGFIPSRMAARKDPVVALRTE